MQFLAEIAARNAEGQFVHFFRDADMPSARLVKEHLQIVLQRDDGYNDVRVLSVRRREE